MMENIIKDDWPIVLIPKNIPLWPVRIYDADGIEHLYVKEINRVTGECLRYLRNDQGGFVLIDDNLATETITLKTPITMTQKVEVWE